MKKLIIAKCATCEGHRLQYMLLKDSNGYLIQCTAFDINKRLVSQYCTAPLAFEKKVVMEFFELLVENCVFPVHIKEILCDCLGDTFATVSA